MAKDIYHYQVKEALIKEENINLLIFDPLNKIIESWIK